MSQYDEWAKARQAALNMKDLLAVESGGQCDGVDGACHEYGALVSAVKALLPVAKAAATADLSGFTQAARWELSCRLVDLEVAYPGWREWA